MALTLPPFPRIISDEALPPAVATARRLYKHAQLWRWGSAYYTCVLIQSHAIIVCNSITNWSLFKKLSSWSLYLRNQTILVFHKLFSSTSTPPYIHHLLPPGWQSPEPSRFCWSCPSLPPPMILTAQFTRSSQHSVGHGTFSSSSSVQDELEPAVF